VEVKIRIANYYLESKEREKHSNKDVKTWEYDDDDWLEPNRAQGLAGREQGQSI